MFPLCFILHFCSVGKVQPMPISTPKVPKVLVFLLGLTYSCSFFGYSAILNIFGKFWQNVPKIPGEVFPDARTQAVDQFVSEIAALERDREKREKLENLQLTVDEWERVDLFLHVLQAAQSSQQQFSSDLRSTLHLAIPALQKLHSKWTSKLSDDKYLPFKDAIEAALAKVDEYYQKTDNTHSYALAMVLDPRRKLAYFNKHWPKNLVLSTKDALEKIVSPNWLTIGSSLRRAQFKERYLQIQSAVALSAPSTSAQKPLTNNRRRASTPPEDDEMTGLSASHVDPDRPWLDEFNEYLQGREFVAQGVSAIEWWGRNYERYPVWGSLARDYLAIMSSSVSSERAFSSAGITISKRRNRLKADVVEALQCLKCFIVRNLLFRDPVVFEPEVEEREDELDKSAPAQPSSWDILVDDDPDNYEFSLVDFLLYKPGLGPGPWARARAWAGSGSGLENIEPKPCQARPGPEHH
ncbi:ribonuclease H-like domain-containing protein [Roridomyces roridus]|uniref:Ribonuclease H-like domain-containing protein n=1 Tax=Roridomyces roridus TaxID=1738132 RepID=A0AAD7BQ52_9AGAR|nr:ribonuclease H-like domain-containing protein [Roridomyces roridus]